MATPSFERDLSHVYQVGEEIYVIDSNGYDVWEAVILSINSENPDSEIRYLIHYPDWPNDDTEYEGDGSFLVRTPLNTQIYQRQERTRQAREKIEPKITQPRKVVKQTRLNKQELVSPSKIPKPQNTFIPQNATLLMLPETPAFSQSHPFSLHFRDGKPNFFFYKTATEEYIIVDGMRFLVKRMPIDKEIYTNVLHTTQEGGVFTKKYPISEIGHILPTPGFSETQNIFQENADLS